MSPIQKLFSVLVMLAAVSCAAAPMTLPATDVPAEPKSFQALRIAHAGGALRKRTYTNSYQALNRSLERGFRYFELDFVFTRDQKLVCLHDWNVNFKKSFGFEPEVIPSLAEFQVLVDDNRRFTNCTLDGLAQWMREHPEAAIVTDVRGPLDMALQVIFATLPDAATRVIPQIYAPEQYAMVREVGYEAFIWTLYRYPGDSDSVLRAINGWTGPFAVTMPEHRVATGLPVSLGRLGVKTYVHTINSTDKWRRYQQLGITEMYTAFLAPGS